MALEWVMLLITLLDLDGLRKSLVVVPRNALKPLPSVVPFYPFLLLDIYWKYETRPSCNLEYSCTPSEFLRHQKSIMKSQRNSILITAALVSYWLLFSVTQLLVKLQQANERIEKLKRQD